MFYHYQDMIYADIMFTQVSTDFIQNVQYIAAIYYQQTTIAAYSRQSLLVLDLTQLDYQ